MATTNGETPSAEDLSSAEVVHLQGTEWVDLFVGEMMSASNIDDAKARASRALEAFEKTICARATEAACRFQKVGPKFFYVFISCIINTLTSLFILYALQTPCHISFLFSFSCLHLLWSYSAQLLLGDLNKR